MSQIIANISNIQNKKSGAARSGDLSGQASTSFFKVSLFGKNAVATGLAAVRTVTTIHITDLQGILRKKSVQFSLKQRIAL